MAHLSWGRLSLAHPSLPHRSLAIAGLLGRRCLEQFPLLDASAVALKHEVPLAVLVEHLVLLEVHTCLVVGPQGAEWSPEPPPEA